jgi:hypothetical protein
LNSFVSGCSIAAGPIAVALLGVTMMGCGNDHKPQPAIKPSATAKPSAAPSAAPGLPTFAAREIPAGAGPPTGAFTVAYSIERRPGDENKTWLEAINACGAVSKSLCSETQWMKACAADPALGKLESWTLTADFPGAAVRGGDGGCGARKFVKVEERSPTRVGVCCSRAIAINSSVTQGPFRADMNDRILKYEAALNQCDTLGLSDLYCDKVAFEKDDFESKVLIERHELERKTSPDLLFGFDRCSLKEANPTSSTFAQAQCVSFTYKQGVARGGTSLIAWNDAGRISFFGTPKNYRAPVAEAVEAKERIDAFISTP